jgi:hypothetical protein
LSRRLIAAAERSLDDPVNRHGLATCAIPLSWIGGGCDLEFDVLPTLAAVASRKRGGKVRAWDYFTDAVYEARDRRLDGTRKAQPITDAAAKRPPPKKIDADAMLAAHVKRVAEEKRQSAEKAAEYDRKASESHKAWMASRAARQEVADVAF